MTISYKYKILPGKKGIKIKTPSIPIVINGKNETPIEVVALIDSGADLSVIPIGLAEFLQLDLSGKKEKSNGIGGQVNVVNSTMNITLKKPHETYNLDIPVQVILDGDDIPPLLGRQGFFDKFKITFDNKNERISLKDNPEPNKY